MKHLIRTVQLLIVISLCLTINTVNAKKKPKMFSGVITYTLTFPDNVDEATKKQMPKTIDVLYSPKGQKMKLDVGIQTMQFLYKAEDSSSYLLMSVMGNKICVKTPGNKAVGDVDNVKYMEETKEIAGYKCKKAEVVTKAENVETVSIVYYTEELGPSAIQDANSVKGIPLEFSLPMGEIKIILTATTVKKSKVKATEFIIPSDYKQMSIEDLKNLGM